MKWLRVPVRSSPLRLRGYCLSWQHLHTARSHTWNQIRYPHANNTKKETISFLQFAAAVPPTFIAARTPQARAFFTVMCPTASPSSWHAAINRTQESARRAATATCAPGRRPDRSAASKTSSVGRMSVRQDNGGIWVTGTLRNLRPVTALGPQRWPIMTHPGSATTRRRPFSQCLPSSRSTLCSLSEHHENTSLSDKLSNHRSRQQAHDAE